MAARGRGLMAQKNNSGIRKAAALLATLGEGCAAHLLKRLNEEEIQRVTQAIAQLQHITSADAETVLDEYRKMLLAQQYIVKGGIDYARDMLYTAFGAEVANRLLERLRERM